MSAIAQERAKWVITHDDGRCADGQRNTPLVEGKCLVCGFIPDTQSTCFIFHCPTHDVQLDKDNKCSVCGNTFYTGR